MRTDEYRTGRYQITKLVNWDETSLPYWVVRYNGVNIYFADTHHQAVLAMERHAVRKLHAIIAPQKADAEHDTRDREQFLVVIAQDRVDIALLIR